jgi:hypothetical protein
MKGEEKQKERIARYKGNNFRARRNKAKNEKKKRKR